MLEKRRERGTRSRSFKKNLREEVPEMAGLCADGMRVNWEVTETLRQFAPHGYVDVVACDQHSSFLKMLKSFFENARAKGKEPAAYREKPSDEDVRKLSKILAKSLGKEASAALFNHLGYLSPGFHKLLGEKTMLIGRLEDTVPDKGSDGGLLAKLAIQPEDIAHKVDGFKTLVKLDPTRRKSWHENLEWLKDVFERCQKLKKPLFNETLLNIEGMSKVEMAERLVEGVVEIARDFGPYGHFYKTQVPMLWVKENGGTLPICTPDEVRGAAKTMARIVPRPMLLLSAAVDFGQYAAQFALVADLVSGPMCGRAYFKDPFSNPKIGSWEALEKAIKQVAIPRMKQIKVLAQNLCQPWWKKLQN